MLLEVLKESNKDFSLYDYISRNGYLLDKEELIELTKELDYSMYEYSLQFHNQKEILNELERTAIDNYIERNE